MSKKNKNNTPKLTSADQSVKGDSTLAEVMKDFNKARSYISGHYEKIWSECFKAYNSIRTRQGYVGVANEFVPETFAIVESLKAAIAGTKPKFKYLPLTEEQEQDTTTLNALVDFYWACNNMTEKMLNWVGDMIIYGNGIFMVSWENGRPLIQHIPLSDFFVDPAATHMNRPEEPGYPRYAGYRFLTSLKQLKAEKEVDPETGEVRDKYKNLDIISLGTQDDNMDKDRKEMYLGSTFGRNAISEQVEVITYYTQYRKVMIANRGTVIYDGENPYHKAEDSVDTAVEIDGEVIKGKHKIPEIKGFLPFAILRNYVDSSLFFARGDVEVILPAQEALNDTASQKRDNVAYVLNNMWQIDPRFKHMAEQIESSPGAVFPIPKGALSPIEKNDISPSADGEIERLRQQMRNATGADAAVQGVAQKFSRTTATEVQAQLQQASMRFTTKVQNLEDEGFAQLARIIYKMIQIFVDTETAVRIVGKKGVEWQTYKPGTYQGEYEPRVVLEATMDAEAAALSQAMQVAAQFSLGNPLVNQEAFLRQQYKVLFGKFLSDDDIEEMLTAPQPVMGPDGQAVDPSLTQANTVMTPGAQALMSGGSDEVPTSQPSSRSARLRQQSGTQGGGGADTSQNNIRRIRADQPSTTLHASSRPR
jgi:hypothetical protein|nr:MAG TPA: Portal protein [Caudoviricetes sp.]